MGVFRLWRGFSKGTANESTGPQSKRTQQALRHRLAQNTRYAHGLHISLWQILQRRGLARQESPNKLRHNSISRNSRPVDDAPVLPTLRYEFILCPFVSECDKIYPLKGQSARSTSRVWCICSHCSSIGLSRAARSRGICRLILEVLSSLF